MSPIAKKITIALLVLGAWLAPASAQAASPAWNIKIGSRPTNFAPGASVSQAGPLYDIFATNVGGAPTAGTVTITDTLPGGLTPMFASGLAQPAENPLDPSGAKCGISGQTVTCTASTVFQPGQFIHVQVGVDVSPSFSEGDIVANHVTVFGGASATQASTITTISSDPAPFGFADSDAGLGASLIDADGQPATQAGGHPFRLTLDVGTSSEKFGSFTIAGAEGGIRDLITELPPGVVVNPNATPVRCTESQLESKACPNAAQVGTVSVSSFASGPFWNTAALYNMVPPPGAAATLGFDVLGIGIYVHVNGGVRAGDYALSAATNDILARNGNPLFAAQAQLWGDPSSRGVCGASSCGLAASPLLTMPTSCGDSIDLTAKAASWLNPGSFIERSTPVTDLNQNPAGVSGCAALNFTPTLQARPTTNVADAPSGLSVDLHIPQTNSLKELATAHLRKAVVTLPEGLSLNPSSANGLQGCSSSQIGIDPGTGVADGNQPSCPDASRIGDVEVDTPLLGHAVAGSVYVASPHDNPFDSLLAIYVVLDDPQTGVLIKLAGHVEPDPNTGQLVTTFDNNPQLPFSDFKLEFFGGPGAVLRTPSVCGTYSTTSSLTPWSAPESGPPATPSDSYAISGSCSSSLGSQPNKPEFDAGAISPIAGKYTPFVVHLKRQDGSQQFKTLTLNPPPGLTAKLAGTPACSDAALASAASKSGTQEQQSPSCPSDSQIGTVTVGAGAGPAPYYAKAKAYLAGPYKGAPLSMAIVTPAVAGPYDLGTVVTKVALHVNAATAQITADADPVPSILQGIPLDVRSVDVSLDKPGFSRTGTSCDPLAVNGQLISTLGQPVALESPFQLGECGRLGFKPKLSLRLKGGTKRGQNPALIANVTAKDGEANIASAAVRLPRSAFLDQSHIKTVCTRVQFAVGAGNGSQCPAGSIYGTATAKSPLLDYTLSGNAYLRSSSHKLPDLVIALQGPPSQPIAIELVGRTDSVKGALRNTFEAVPDAPVSSFRLELFGGKRGLVINSRNLCANAYSAAADLTAHSGKIASLKPVVQTSCKKGAHKKQKRHR